MRQPESPWSCSWYSAPSRTLFRARGQSGLTLTGERADTRDAVAQAGHDAKATVTRVVDEGFYVLAGDVTFYVGEEIHEAHPGTFVFLPQGVPHSYTFETDEVRMLAIVAPGGIEQHFRDPRFVEPAEAATLPPATTGPPDMAVLEELAEDLASYGTEVVGPPGPPEQG